MRLVLQTLVIKAAIAFFAMMIAAPEMAFALNADQWAPTGLSDSDLKIYINQNSCYASDKNFLGCIAAINSLLESSSPAKILTNKKIENAPGMGDTVGQAERLKVQLYTPIATPISVETLQEYKKNRDAVTASWKMVYALTKEKQLSISKLLDAALAHMDSGYRSTNIANAINEFYKNALDPHTYIMVRPASSLKDSGSSTGIVGIGADLRPFGNSIIMLPFHNSPALAAGVRPFDILLEVNDETVSGKSAPQAAKMIMGEENSPVKVKILRDQQILTFEILRRKIILKNLELQFLNDSITKEKIAYIRISTFMQEGVCKEFLALARAAKGKGAKGLVLDLRNNLGGWISQAECIMTSYLEKGQILYTENDPTTGTVKTEKRDEDGAPIYEMFGKKPLVILLNGQSASASEMLAGSLRAHARAIIIGERSFGKGTMQGSESLLLGNAKDITLMRTFARFHFADGSSNQLVGIHPDIEVIANKQIFTLREADFYPNAIAAGGGKPFYPKALKNFVKKCIDQRGMLESNYAERLNSHLVPNQQLAVAREAASCL